MEPGEGMGLRLRGALPAGASVGETAALHVGHRDLFVRSLQGDHWTQGPEVFVADKAVPST